MNGNNELEKKQNQLIEIYRIHVEQANNVSNRRTTINRFYQVFLSGLIVIFIAFLQNKHGGTDNFWKAVSIEWIMLILGGLGMWLASIWGISLHSYILLNARKYETLKILEDELAYQFLQQEWELLGSGRYKTYKNLANIEFLVPSVFFLSFLMLFVYGVYKWEGEDSRYVELFVRFVIYSLGFLLGVLVYRSLMTDGISIYKKIRRKFST